MLQFCGDASDPRSGERQRAPRAFLAAAFFVVIAGALCRAVNHDESQYVAAIALMRQGVPYRDFAYLQTPLQPLLLSPLGYLPAGWVWIGARLANAAFGCATILLLRRALAGRASPSASVIALAALVCTDAFLLASSLARNDALAMVLLAAALPPLLCAARTRSIPMFALGGLALGLATSAKISAALPAAGAGLFMLLHLPRYRARGLSAFGAGLLVGLLPVLAMAAIAPGPFRFDVFEYNLEAPAQWWRSISQAGELDPLRRVVKLVGFAGMGSVLVALAAIPWDRCRTDERRLLDFMIAGGIIAAFLPVPALVQYLVPLLPALFARFALALDGAPAVPKRVLVVLAGVGSIAGLTSSFAVRFAGLELVRGTAVGNEVAGLARGGRVATLSPEYVAGDSVLLDPRFAAGPFLFRTHGALARRAETQGRAATARSVDGALSSCPPAVILVGAEARPYPPAFPAGLDRPLEAWGMANGYRRVQLRGGLAALVDSRNGVSGLSISTGRETCLRRGVRARI